MRKVKVPPIHIQGQFAGYENLRPDIPVILCTGYSKNLSEERASEIGIKAFAYKPIVKEDLAKIVREVLGLART